MADPVVPFDLMRMFVGDNPPLFFAEIIVRTLIVYSYTLVLVRWVGGRGIAQMSMVEFLLVIALGSAVGDAPFYPEVPLLYALLVITVVVLMNKGLDILIARFRPAERLIDGSVSCVLKDGVIDIETLTALNIGQSEFFQSVREHGHGNLGALRAGYLESSGRFSFFEADTPVAGLRIEPPWALEPPPMVGPGASSQGAVLACMTCGRCLPQGSHQTPVICTTCGHDRWTPAHTPRG